MFFGGPKSHGNGTFSPLEWMKEFISKKISVKIESSRCPKLILRRKESNSNSAKRLMKQSTNPSKQRCWWNLTILELWRTSCSNLESGQHKQFGWPSPQEGHLIRLFKLKHQRIYWRTRSKTRSCHVALFFYMSIRYLAKTNQQGM